MVLVSNGVASDTMGSVGNHMPWRLVAPSLWFRIDLCGQDEAHMVSWAIAVILMAVVSCLQFISLGRGQCGVLPQAPRDGAYSNNTWHGEVLGGQGKVT